MKAIKITAYTEDKSQIEALKAVMKAMKIKFVVDQDESPYDPEFVEKIKASQQQARQGRVTKIEKKDLKEFLDL